MRVAIFASNGWVWTVIKGERNRLLLTRDCFSYCLPSAFFFSILLILRRFALLGARRQFFRDRRPAVGGIVVERNKPQWMHKDLGRLSASLPPRHKLCTIWLILCYASYFLNITRNQRWNAQPGERRCHKTQAQCPFFNRTKVHRIVCDVRHSTSSSHKALRRVPVEIL